MSETFLCELSCEEIKLVTGGQAMASPVSRDFAKVLADVRNDASHSVIQADFHTLLHDLHVPGY